MNIGPYQVIYWGPSVSKSEDGDIVVTVPRPCLRYVRGAMAGIYRWCAMVGWVEVRRFATDEEINAACAPAGEQR